MPVPSDKLTIGEAVFVEAVNNVLARKGRQWCPQTPTERQREFLDVDAFEALYGGQAGGGKSSALLMGALQHVDKPGYAALILRRTYADLALPGAIMDRSHEWLAGKPGVRWDDTTKTWHFPSGATVSFGYLQYDRDRYRYQGAELQYLAFDELTQFPEAAYRYLLSRVRRVHGIDAPLRVRSGTNPGGIGHDWVFERFVNADTRGDRVFVPARLEDNPYLDTAEYERSLAQLDPVTRMQLRHGDWTVRQAGGLLDRAWFRIVDEAPADLEYIGRSWDEAATKGGGDWTVGALVGYKAGTWYVLDVQRVQASPNGVDALMDQTAALDGWRVPVLLQQEPGSSGKARVAAHRGRLTGFDVRAAPPTGDKSARARPLASAAEAGNVALVNGSWIRAFLEEAEVFPVGAHDDQVDAISWAMIQLAFPERRGNGHGAPVPVDTMAGGLMLGTPRSSRFAPGRGSERYRRS